MPSRYINSLRPIEENLKLLNLKVKKEDIRMETVSENITKIILLSLEEDKIVLLKLLSIYLIKAIILCTKHT